LVDLVDFAPVTRSANLAVLAVVAFSLTARASVPFEFGDGAQGWTASACATVSLTEPGEVGLALTCDGAELTSPALSADAASLGFLQIVAHGTYRGAVDVRFVAAGETHTLTGALALRGDGLTHRYVVALGQHPAWAGTVDSLALVFPTGVAAVTLHRVALVRSPWRGVWSFGDDGDLSGWTPSLGVAGVTVASGAISGGVVPGAPVPPRLQSPAGRRFDSRRYRTLLVTVSSASPTVGQALRVYWGTEQSPSLNISRSMTAAYNADGGKQTLRFDLYEHAKWRGQIERMWVQPFVVGETGATFSIDAIAFGSRFDFETPGDKTGFVGGPVGTRVSDGALRGVAKEAFVVEAQLATPSAPFDAVVLTAALEPDEVESCALGLAFESGGVWTDQPVSATCDGQPHTLVIDVSGKAGWASELTAVRLSIPGSSDSGRAFAIERLHVLADGPSLELVSVLPSAPQLVGSPVTMTALLENRGATASTGGKLIIGGQFAAVPPLQPFEQHTVTVELTGATSCGQAGKQTVSVNAQLPGLNGDWSSAVKAPLQWRDPMAASSPVVPAEGAPGQIDVGGDVIVIENARVRVTLHKDACLGGFGYLQLYAAQDGVWQPVGARQGLARLALAGDTQADVELTGAVPGSVTSADGVTTLPMSQTWTDPDGAQWVFSWIFSVSADVPWIQVGVTATPDAPRQLALFTGPAVEVALYASAGPVTGGLMGALELLAADEHSSSSAALAHPDFLRATPDVRLSGLPVMAASVDGRTGGLIWQPTDSWAPNLTQPSVRFQSPNVDGDRPTALMQLRAPNAPQFALPGDPVASAPLPVAAGQTLSLSAALFAVTGDGADAAMSVVHAYFGTKSPSAVSVTESRQLVKQALGATGWTGDGWVAVEGAAAAPHADVLAVARRLALVDGDAVLATRADAASGLLDGTAWLGGTRDWVAMEAPFTDGPTVDALAQGWVALKAEAEQGPVAAKHLLTGSSSADSAGIAWRLLRFGRLTGHQEALDLGLARLASLTTVGVARGGSLHHGVPASAPDVASCIDAAMAHREAFLLTGDADYDLLARRWVMAALSFAHLFDGAGQPAGYTAYGVTAALGGRHYTDSLLGQVSATQGARLALAALAMVEDTTFAWETVGTGLLHAVIARQLGTDVAKAGHVHEVWDLRTKSAGGGLVLPHLIARALLALSGDGLALKTATVDVPTGAEIVIAGLGDLTGAEFVQGTYSVQVAAAAAAGGATVVTFGRLGAKPDKVLLDGKDISEVASLAGVTSGWRYDAQIDVLGVRTAASSATIAVPFPIPDADKDGFPANLDCDDTNKDVNPDATETCNNVDDDCDGETDDPDVTGFVECGIGVCAHTEPACVAGESIVCDPFKGLGDEACDNLDNDCDGLTDEEVGNVLCGVGICSHTIYACADCDPLEGAEPEVCDTLDNDCDGETDETAGTVLCGTGACEHLISVCEIESCEPFAGASDEVCNLVDDDCDGETDEGLPTAPCGTGQCLHDIPACAPCDALTGATDEVCDLVDNDCDGETDEDTPTQPCGTGACAQELPLCHQCDPLAGVGLEVCNSVDDDCDGETDEVEGTKPCGTGECYQVIGACEPCDAVAGATDEVCDGLDNDCDGKTDEVTETAICGVGACAHEVTACTQCDGFLGAAPETCNALDDDCDGQTDEPEDLGTKTCGVGACEHELPLCTAGEDTPCDPLTGAEDESCDGVDNDCDGTTDEDIGIYTCGVGACAHDVVGCTLEGPGACDPLLGAQPEVCDDVDNDCDGETDEEQGLVVCGADQGCEKELDGCVNGQPVACNPVTGLAPELCNGEDDDCDGATDEDQVDIVCGVGICLHATDGCVDGAPNVCDPFEGAQEETCNFVDDDCDGEVDESSPPVTCGLGICVNTSSGCESDGTPVPCEPLNLAKPDVCNNVDDDCDGETDEGQGEIVCGVGACMKSVPLCLNGEVQACDPDTGGAPEICNGIDDNCDGETDEGQGTFVCGEGACARPLASCTEGQPTPCDPFLGLTPEICDGVDNDCDGEADEKLGVLTCTVDGELTEVPACQNGVAVTCDGPTGTAAGDDTGGATTGSVGGGTLTEPGADEGCQAGQGRGSAPPWGLLLMVLLALTGRRLRGGLHL